MEINSSAQQFTPSQLPPIPESSKPTKLTILLTLAAFLLGVTGGYLLGLSKAKTISQDDLSSPSLADAWQTNENQTLTPSPILNKTDIPTELPPLYPDIKWGPPREGQFETSDRDGPSEVQGYIIHSEALSEESSGLDIYFKHYQSWLQQEGWQGYADFGGVGRGFKIGWKKDGKYFIFSEEKTGQEAWVLVIRHN